MLIFWHIIYKSGSNAFISLVRFNHLQLTNSNSRLIPHPEARIDRLTKRGFKLMNKWHRLRHGVERKSAPCTVQKHPDTGTVGCINLNLVFMVSSWIAGVRAEETPGLAVVANTSWVSVTCSLDAFKSHTNGGSLSAPLHLPVVGTFWKGLFTQDLGQAVKSLVAVIVRLRVFL